MLSSLTSSRPRLSRGWLACALLLAGAGYAATPSPYLPASDSEVLAYLPPGIRHATSEVRQRAATRIDVALPLAQFYISQSRATGDLRFLGYAEALLAPWRDRAPPTPAVLVLDATILQSRHAFPAALAEVDRVLQLQPDDAQTWLVRATVLRVLGRYDEAVASCGHLRDVDPVTGELCAQSVRGISGYLDSAYAAILRLPQVSLSNDARAWRYSELGELAAARGDTRAAEHWFREALELAPADAYTRVAYADLLLSEARPMEVLQLLNGHESMEPALLRITLAQLQLADPREPVNRALLASAFNVEELRGEAVHRREQARFLLDVVHEPSAALAAAQENWHVQREPADALILLRAAQAAGRPDASAAAAQFVRLHDLQDVRLEHYLPGIR
jgi:tetratricopeptide (TPR) repeat protein